MVFFGHRGLHGQLQFVALAVLVVMDDIILVIFLRPFDPIELDTPDLPCQAEALFTFFRIFRVFSSFQLGAEFDDAGAEVEGLGEG